MCFYRAMKYENNVSIMVGCLQAVKSYSFTKEIKLYIYGSYIVLFVKSARFERIFEKVKRLNCVSGFQLSALKFLQLKRLPRDRLLPGYEGAEKMFCFLNKLTKIPSFLSFGCKVNGIML